jgi:hypothetical protein
MNTRTTTTGMIATLVTTLLIWGCGGNGAGNNDQGVSVTLLGFYSALPDPANNQNPGGGAGGAGGFGNGANCAVPTQPVNRILLRLGTSGDEPGGPGDGSTVGNTDASSGATITVGVQNNLIGQFFRADRMLLSYFIPGSAIQPPSTNVPLTLLAGPASLGTAQPQPGIGVGGGANGNQNNQTNQNNPRRPANTSLPPSFGNVCNQGYAQTLIMPAAVREWINFHRDELPEPPYTMEAYVTVAGLSSSGNRIETNTQGIAIDVLPETFVEPTDGTVDGTDEAGATSFGGSEGGDSSGDDDVNQLGDVFGGNSSGDSL